MMQVVEGRELITLDRDGLFVHGTYHRPHNDSTDLANCDKERVGVLFLNSLSLPRTATGDSAVYWADCLAACGYPTFRVDLPGLGDSDGQLPRELLDFINSGGFARMAAQNIEEVANRFNLSGVVIVGHCAGAASALFAAAASTICKGLVLMDVYFYLPQAVRPKMRRMISDWALRSRLGRFASNIYDKLRAMRLRISGDKLPENANIPLIRSWKELASGGLPILILKAPARKAMGAKPRAGEFDYLEYALKIAGNRHKVSVQYTEGTDHSFANRHGRNMVRQYTEDWLISHFPLAEMQASSQLAAPSHSVN
jgi:pimeloyl-ACP methyl ester carboxylesterase